MPKLTLRFTLVVTSDLELTNPRFTPSFENQPAKWVLSLHKLWPAEQQHKVLQTLISPPGTTVPGGLTINSSSHCWDSSALQLACKTVPKVLLWWWHTVKKLVQETCTSRLVQETWPSDMVSWTRFFLYKFLAPNTAQLYSIQETYMHVTRMVSSDWSATYHCHVFILFSCFHFVVLMSLTVCCTKLI